MAYPFGQFDCGQLSVNVMYWIFNNCSLNNNKYQLWLRCWLPPREQQFLLDPRSWTQIEPNPNRNRCMNEETLCVVLLVRCTARLLTESPTPEWEELNIHLNKSKNKLQHNESNIPASNLANSRHQWCCTLYGCDCNHNNLFRGNIAFLGVGKMSWAASEGWGCADGYGEAVSFKQQQISLVRTLMRGLRPLYLGLWSAASGNV